MVSDITGISSGKPLSKVLPADAKKATMVYFRMRFTHGAGEARVSNEWAFSGTGGIRATPPAALT
jgi:hypothetical protein